MSRTIKRHDTADPITGTAKVQDMNPESPTFGQLIPADLTIYETVLFHAKVAADGQEILIGGSVAEANDDGTWVYEQDPEDVQTAASNPYDGELECVLENGKKVHFPNRKADNPKLTIDEDLDDN